MLHETIRNDFWRNTALQYRCDIVCNDYNIVPALQRWCCSKNRRCESSRVTSPLRSTKGDVIRDDSQGQFLAQHSVAMLEKCCNHSKQYRNNVVMLCCTKNRRCESPRVISP